MVRAPPAPTSRSRPAVREWSEALRAPSALPFGLVTLMGRDYQYVLASSGEEEIPAEVPRETSFCTHAILEDEVFEVDDASADSRFAEKPFVTGGRACASTPACPSAPRTGTP